MALTLWLLHQEKNPDSKFAEFLDIMPKGVSEFPCMFGEDDMELLKGSQNLLLEIEKITRQIK